MVSSEVLKSFPIYYQNVNGLRTKTSTFRRAVQMCHYKIIVLTETGLTESINSNEIFDDSFSVFRCDRSERSSDKISRGGVLVGVHSS